MNVRRGDTQLVVFKKQKKTLLCNKCARNKQTFALGEGLTGDDIASSETWVSCPYRKRNFILNGADAGQCIDDPELSIAAFEVEEREDQWVYLKLPPVEELDRRLGTSRWMVKKSVSKDPFERLDGKLKGLKGRKPFEKSHLEGGIGDKEAARGVVRRTGNGMEW